MIEQRKLFLVLVIALVIPSFALKATTPKQLEALASRTEFAVVVFHSDATEHSKELSKRTLDEFAKVSMGMQNEQRIRFFSVSLDTYPEAIATYQLNDIPCILIFREGYPRIYHGQRVVYTLVTFFQDLLNSEPVKIIESKTTKNLFAHADSGVRVIGYFSDFSGEQYEAFKLTAKHYQGGEISFGVIKDAKLARTFKFTEPGTFSLIKPGERPIFVKNLVTREAIVNWLDIHKKPLWEVLTFNNIYSVWQGDKTSFVVFLKSLEDFSSKSILSIFKTLAKDYATSHNIDFIIVDATHYKEFVRGVGFSEQDLPNFAIFHPERRSEFFFPKEKMKLTLKNIQRWLDNVLAGKVLPESRENGENEVLQLNNTNIEEVVNNEKNDVLVEFRADWCGKCEEFSPHYKLLGRIFHPITTMIISSFDVGKFEYPKNYNVSTLPCLMFFPAKNKTPVVFSGVFDVDGISRFILEHQTTFPEKVVEALTNLINKDKENLEEMTDEDFK